MANKKVYIIGLSSLILMVLTIGVVVTYSINGGHKDSSSSSGITTSSKAVEEICRPTDYKKTCMTTLSASAGNTTNPNELIKIAVNITIEHVMEAMKKSTVLQEAEKDPRTHAAYQSCKELLEDSADDLKELFDNFGSFDLAHIDDHISDLKTWLSGALTFQETCLDAFENTTGNAGENMKKVLQISGELTRNGLAMIDEFSKTISHLSMSGRRLLSSDEIPTWVNAGKRRLLASSVHYPSFVVHKLDGALKPNVVVAMDGSGNVRTIGEALAKVPKKNKKPFVIFIKAGVYKEYVEVTKKMSNVVMLGEGPTKTIITGNKNFVDGINTYKTATVVVQGKHFFAKGIGFENSAGASKHQAVAIRVSADLAIFYQCNFDGYQDTLYAHSHRQYYRDCTISGTIDFIFGNAAAVFQNCVMVVRKPLENQSCMVTAQGRNDKRENTGLLLQKCSIVASPDFKSSSTPIEAYLGRPWKAYSRTIIVNSNIDGFIDPKGWSPWAGSFGLETSFYVEYGNTGEGAEQSKRVKWPAIKKLNPQQLAVFNPARFITGNVWVKPTGLPYESSI